VNAESYQSHAEKRNRPWVIHPDYYGVASCVFQILHLKEMTVIERSVNQVRRLQWKFLENKDEEIVLIPSFGLKRYSIKILTTFFHI
jgi:hypothetical protein